MPYCTIVEFEWDQTFDRERFAAVVGQAGDDAPPPAGRLSHITGIDDTGARMIEVWQSSGDAKAHADQSAPFLPMITFRLPDHRRCRIRAGVLLPPGWAA